jgi:hypothetical protein
MQWVTDRKGTLAILGTIAALLSSVLVLSGSCLAENVPVKARLAETYSRLPLYFIENHGQTDSKVGYYTRGPGHATYFTRQGLAFQSRPAAYRGKGKKFRSGLVWLHPLGMRSEVQVQALEPQSGKVSYFIGNDPKKWRTDIPTYGAVLYREAYPGIDLKFYGSGRQLEYDIIVRPGADPTRVQFQYRGAKGLRLTPEGDLLLTLADGQELRQKKPRIYQEIAGQQVAREGKFRLTGNKARLTYGFEVASYDRQYPLIIDPELVYSTYLGGTGLDYAYGLAVDGDGNAFITGGTRSSDFPTKDSPYPYQGSDDVFVTKINPAGTQMVYSAILGGEGSDIAYGIAVDGQGNAYITGTTYSYTFPEKQAILTRGGGRDAFVAKLNAAGNDLIYSTYLGGGSTDEGYAIAADAEGNAYVTGYTLSSYINRFPTKNPLKADNLTGGPDAFVTKINPDGSALVYSTYLGGSSSDTGYGIVADDQGNAYITGETYSTDFPTKNPYQAQRGADTYKSDVFITKINVDGSDYLYSTYLGGSDDDIGQAIALDREGYIYVTGYIDDIDGSGDTDFPIKNPLPFPFQAYGDTCFVTKFTPDGQALVYSTYLPGGRGIAIAADQAGKAYITAYGPILSVVNAPGTALIYSLTYHDLGNPQLIARVGLDRVGNIYLAGWTAGDGLVLKNPLFTYQGGSEAYLAKFSPLASSLGSSLTAIMDLLLLGD